MNRKDVLNERFGKWLVTEEVGRDKRGSVLWRCICECGNTKEIPTDALLSGKTTQCRPCGSKSWKRPPKRTRHISAKGYVVLCGIDHPNTNHGKLFEHVYVMSQHLKRPLFKGETVHHKNGVKDDNRLDNLELWNKPQPTGCRVEDQIKWAKEILERYGDFTKIRSDGRT